MAMNRSRFAELVDAARAAHPVWFDLPTDALAGDADLVRVSRRLGVELPSDYAWFLREYGGGDFGLATIYSAEEGSDLYVIDHQPAESDEALLAFSDNGAGDLYVFPVKDGVAADTVLVRDHETGELAARADGFLSFVAETGLQA